jgi:hypothetical protein
LAATYAAGGFGEEWKLHHQAAPGLRPREKYALAGQRGFACGNRRNQNRRSPVRKRGHHPGDFRAQRVISLTGQGAKAYADGGQTWLRNEILVCGGDGGARREGMAV